MEEWEEHLKHLREHKVPREEQLRKIHRHKSVLKKSKRWRAHSKKAQG